MKEIIRLNEEQLRKMVNESIKKKIMETMGINDEMESESSSLVHFIQKNIRKAPIEYDEDLNQNYHILTYDHQFENKKFHWTIIGYIYPDDDNFKDNHDVQISEGRSSSNGRDIFFGWIYFSMTEDGWFNFAEVSDSVYHEMLHLLKTKKAKKYTGNLNFINASNKQYNTTEGIEKDIAVICYMSREDEQDAFINGLYGILKEEFLYHQNINVVQINIWICTIFLCLFNINVYILVQFFLCFRNIHLLNTLVGFSYSKFRLVPVKQPLVDICSKIFNHITIFMKKRRIKFSALFIESLTHLYRL